MNKHNLRRLLDAVLAALVLALIVTSEFAAKLDAGLADELYQRRTDPGDNIVIFGIDQPTVQRMGKPASWLRKKLPDVIRYLDGNDPTARPAAIGIDYLFPGANKADPEIDRRLAKACAEAGNVVIAGALIVPDEVIRKNEDMPSRTFEETWPWSGPFPELAKATAPGHVVALNEPGGRVRHALDHVHTKELGDVDSFAAALYHKWCDRTGNAPKEAPVTGKDGVYYLPFSSDEYATYSLLDLMEGKIDSEVYRDKIVLIGACYPGTKDIYRTPLSPSDTMYGVMVQANAIDAYAHGFFPRYVGDTLQIAFFFLICALAEYCFRTWQMQRAVFLWLALSAGALFLCWFCYQCGFILHPLWIPVAATILFIGSLAGNYLRIRAEQIRLNTVFGRYFDETVMKQLLAEDSEELKLGGREREIAVLFVDIRGFTTMSEKLLAPDVVDILNHYLKLATECVRRHQGTLDKFIGDCAMAFWNAPRPQENAVLLACRAAVDMVHGIANLQETVKKNHDCNITFGVGIHWGKAVVGNIGSALRMDYTAIGDTVNTAARLEANAGGGEIYISREVANLLGDLAEVAPPDTPVKLKGKDEFIEVLKLVSLEGQKIASEEGSCN